MGNRSVCFILVVLFCVSQISEGSDGDADPAYRECLDQYEQSGCVDDHCLTKCKQSSVSSTGIGDLYLKWKQTCCQSDCRRYCIQIKEAERKANGYPPIKYHGKWPFKSFFGLQEPVAAAFSAINLVIHFTSWLSFRSKSKAHYEYSTLWQFYAFFQVNKWLWSTIMHIREIEIIKRINFSCTNAAIGFSLTTAILRSFGVREEASKVMVFAPVLAFSTTHILFLNNYSFNYGAVLNLPCYTRQSHRFSTEWNHQVTTGMAVAELGVWGIWACFGRHSARWKVWVFVVGSCVVMFLKSLDFPPYDGTIDGHCLALAVAAPLTWIWWSFVSDDAKLRSNSLRKKQ